ncbi:MAG: dihydropteroate synthase [Rickettsiales bacterium]|nr:dihydropteroate synthase [Rickettsiales bacterium]
MTDNDDCIFLAVGTNLGNRKQNILDAIRKLWENKISVLQVSPLYETSALLLKHSPSSWNIPYYNCAIKIKTDVEPLELLHILKKIEKEMGRDFTNKWSPRIIDLDIIFYKNQNVNLPELTIPHKSYRDRSFVLDPLSFLCPERIKDYYVEQHRPLFMGIINISPDSFSGGAGDNFVQVFENWVENNVQIIDIGAESTNPNSKAITATDEINRLKDVFEYIKNKKFDELRPILSIDTYHPETAEIAIKNGFDMVNDVSGFENEKMLDLAKDNKNVRFVFSHNLGVPANKNVVVPDEKNIIEELEKWLEHKLNIFDKNGIEKEQIIFDVGIGFGKTPSQNLQILQNIENFHRYGVKIAVGHSRKSFMSVFTEAIPINRDIETIAISMKLANKVDIIRVHTPVEHKRALLAQEHINNQFV